MKKSLSISPLKHLKPLQNDPSSANLREKSQRHAVALAECHQLQLGAPGPWPSHLVDVGLEGIAAGFL